jgi:hypothetical protein
MATADLDSFIWGSRIFLNAFIYSAPGATGDFWAGVSRSWLWTAMNYMSSVSVTVGGASFVCVPSLVCRGRVTLLTCFACCAVSIYKDVQEVPQPTRHSNTGCNDTSSALTTTHHTQGTPVFGCHNAASAAADCTTKEL